MGGAEVSFVFVSFSFGPRLSAVVLRRRRGADDVFIFGFGVEEVK